MMRVVKYIVVPFRLSFGRLLPDEPRMFDEEHLARQAAGYLSARWAGAAAYEVHLDPETGSMHDPREIVVHGAVAGLDEDLAA